MLLTVIIPIFNEINTLPELFKKVEAVPIKKETIFIDDGSTDGTRQWLKDLKGENIKTVFHEKNKGKGAAIRTGLKEASGDIVIIQDADLEYDPMEYLKLVAFIRSGETQVVYGSRVLGSKERSYHRYYWGDRLLTLLTNILYGLPVLSG